MDLLRYDVSICCRKHTQEKDEQGLLDKPDPNLPALGQYFIACEDCGYKRCPKATDCELECTNSNEPGQEGSDY